MPEFNPCPFCGNTHFTITPERRFYEMQSESGTASICARCFVCDADMWEHSLGERDYDKRIQMLADKWNRRANCDR